MRVLHTVRSSVSSFNLQYPLFFLRPFSSCLLLLPRFPLLPFICLSITCFRRQFLHKMWPIQLAILLFIVFKGFFSFLYLHLQTILSDLAVFKPFIRCNSNVGVVCTRRPCLSVLYLGTVPTRDVLASYGFRWPAAFPQGYSLHARILTPRLAHATLNLWQSCNTVLCWWCRCRQNINTVSFMNRLNGANFELIRDE